MNILLFGAGAIGTYVGGSLALAGHTVAFIERPEAAGIIARQGLILRLGQQTEKIRPALLATSQAEALAAGPYDFGVFALKSFDTASALQPLRSTDAPVPPLLCFQNGVDNERQIAQVLGADHVIAGTVTTAIGKPGVGEIVLERKRGVGVAQEHPLSLRIVEALTGASLGARAYPVAGPMKWSKLLTNLIGNATSAILDLTVAELFSDRRLFDLELAMLRECLAVMRAQGYHPVDLPGTPVRALAFAIEHLPRTLAQPILQRAVARGRGGKMPSFHIDLHSGRGKTEVHWLNGAVARYGAEQGVPAPVNLKLTDTLEALTSGRLDQAEFRHQPDRLLRLINA